MSRPMTWGALVALLGRDAMPGVEVVEGRRYGRTVELKGRKGVVFAACARSHPPGSGHLLFAGDINDAGVITGAALNAAGEVVTFVATPGGGGKP